MLTQVDVRRRRIGGAIAVLVGVLLIVLAVLAMTGRLGATDKSDGASDAAKSAGATSQSSDSSGSGESSESSESSGSSGSEASGSDAPEDVKAPLTVLNGGAVGGLAAAGQAEFEAGGWEVAEIGNYVGEQPLEQSTVFYSSGDDQAKAAAEALAAQYTELAVEEAPADLGYDGVVVVLAGEWTPGG